MSRFSDLFGQIKNRLDSTLATLLEDLSTGNSDRELVCKSISYPGHYRDEQMNLAGTNPVGPAAAPTEDPAGEGWLFAGGSTDNVAVMARQINHDCQQGETIIIPHIHWRKTTAAAGNVVWRLEYKLAAPGGDFGNYVQVGTDQKLPVSGITDNNTAVRHLITSFGNLAIPVSLSSMIIFKLTRVASDTVNDTYGTDALAMSFDYHYPVDSPGSREELRK